MLHRMASKLNTPLVALIPAQELNNKTHLKLSLSDYNVNEGSIGCDRDGTKFAFAIWPMTDATATALEGVALKRGRILLDCCGQPLLLDLESLERKEPHKARIVGRIVSGISDSMGSHLKANPGD